MKNRKIENKDISQFGIVLGIILTVFGAIHFFKGHVTVCMWFLSFVVIVLFLSFLKPCLLKPIYIGFTRFAKIIGWINTRLILILVYYFILTPIGLIFKILGKDLLNRKLDKNAETYWIKPQRTVSVKESLEKQF